MTTSAAAPPAWVNWVMPIVIVAAIAAAYADSLQGPFIFDDYNAVLSNTHVRSVFPLRTSMSEDPGTVLNGRPLTCLSMALNYHFAPQIVMEGSTVPSPVGFHLFNLGTHIACALLLFGVLRRTMLMPRWEHRFDSCASIFSGAVTLIWALHPLQTEAVTYITQRTETMMAMFLLLVLYALARAAESRDPIGWWILAVIACAAGMASKEVMVVAPFLAALYVWVFLPGESSWRDRILFLCLMLLICPGLVLLYAFNYVFLQSDDRPALSALCWILAVTIPLIGWLLFTRNSRGRYLCLLALFLTMIIIPIELHGADLASKSGYGLSYVGRIPYLRTQAIIIHYYLWLTIWPRGLVIDYFDWPIIWYWWPPKAIFTSNHVLWDQIKYFLGWLVPSVVLTVALVASVIGCILRRWEGFLGAWFFLILGPTSSFLPNFTEIAAERRMYLPIASVIIFVLAFVWGKLAGRVKPFLIAVGVTAGVLGIVTYARNSVYQSSLSIWTDAYEKRPANPRVIFFLGLAYYAQNDWSNARLYDEMSLAILPNFRPANVLQGYIRTKAGDRTAVQSGGVLLNPSIDPLRAPGGSFPNVPNTIDRPD
ncbi:MAG: glycosyltransferase family 39 protein [Tepidisphaeraceae bacterium]